MRSTVLGGTDGRAEDKEDSGYDSLGLAMSRWERLEALCGLKSELMSVPAGGSHDMFVGLMLDEGAS